jgi:deoxyadenosine/deoxycytidine kinase
MTKRLVLVAGNIGAGKTTITDRLATRLGWEAGFESVGSNPFLADFYGDMKEWAFHLQMYFLGDRADQHMRLAHHPNSAIIDRSIYEDAHIFARAQQQGGDLDEREYQAYRRLYDLIEDQLPKPDLLIYLDTSVPVLLDRIKGRGREMESGITGEYLSLLDGLYEEWIATFDLCPVLKIPSDNLNFVTNEKHIAIIIEKMEQKLSGKEEVVFPKDL